MSRIECWHFARDDGKLGYDDGREIVAGETISVTGEPVLCDHGLHGSRRIIDALRYAPGSRVCCVEIWGNVAEEADKLVGSNRKTLWMFDSTDLLRRFARRCALDVIHLWDAPPIVLRYLKTGDESIRARARASVWARARASVWASARASALDSALASARDSALDSVWASAWASAWDSALDSALASARDSANASARDSANASARDSVWASAWDSAWDSARDKESRRLTQMVIAEARKQGLR